MIWSVTPCDSCVSHMARRWLLVCRYTLQCVYPRTRLIACRYTHLSAARTFWVCGEYGDDSDFPLPGVPGRPLAAPAPTV